MAKKSKDENILILNEDVLGNALSNATPENLYRKPALVKTDAESAVVNPFADKTKPDIAPLRHPFGTALTTRETTGLSSGLSKGITAGTIEAGGAQDFRASNQSTSGLIGKWALQTASEIVFGAAEGIGYLGDLEQHINLATGQEQEFGNWFSDIMKSAKESVSGDIAPIELTTAASNQFAPWDGTWWASNGVSVGSALSMMIPARAAVGLLGRAGKAIGAGNKFLKGAKAINATKGVTGAVVSRYMENTMEASDVFESLLQEGLESGLSEEEATKIAGEAASKSWYTNSANLVFDIPQYMLMFRGMKPLKFKAGATTKLGKAASTIGQTAIQAGGEGLEEIGQFITSEEAKASGRSKIKGGESTFFGKDFAKRLDEYSTDSDLWTSAFFGALGGGVFQAAGAISEGRQSRARAAQEDNLESERMVQEGLAQDRAAVMGDLETFTKVGDAAFNNAFKNHLKAGTLDQFREDLVKIQNSTPEEMEQLGMDPAEVERMVGNRLSDLDFAEAQVDRIFSDPTISEIIKQKKVEVALEQRFVERSITSIGRDIANLNSQASSTIAPEGSKLKDLIARRDAYKTLPKEFKDKISKLDAEIKAETAAIKKANPEFNVKKDLITSADNELQDKYNKLISEQELLSTIKDDVIDLETPKGKAKFEKAAESAKTTKGSKMKADVKAQTSQANTPTEFDNLEDVFKSNPEALALVKEARADKATKLQQRAKAINPNSKTLAQDLDARYESPLVLQKEAEEINNRVQSSNIDQLVKDRVNTFTNDPEGFKDFVGTIIATDDAGLAEVKDIIVDYYGEVDAVNKEIKKGDFGYEAEADDIQSSTESDSHIGNEKKVKDPNSMSVSVPQYKLSAIGKIIKAIDVFNFIDWEHINKPETLKPGTVLTYRVDLDTIFGGEDPFHAKMTIAERTNKGQIQIIDQTGAVVGVVPAYVQGKDIHSASIKALRTDIFEGVNNSLPRTGIHATGITTKVTKKYQGRIHITNEIQGVKEIVGDNPFVLGVAVKGDKAGEIRLKVPNAPDGYGKDITFTPATKGDYKGVLGKVYLLVPTSNGVIKPVRIFTKKLSDPALEGLFESVMEKFDGMNLENWESLRDEIFEVVHVNFKYSEDSQGNGKITHIKEDADGNVKAEEVTIEADRLTDWVGDKIAQVDVDRINDKDNAYNNSISDEGRIVSDLNPNHFTHSASFEVSPYKRGEQVVADRAPTATDIAEVATATTITKAEAEGLANEARRLQDELTTQQEIGFGDINETTAHGIVASKWIKVTPESASEETELTTGNKGDISTSLLSKKGITVQVAAGKIYEDLSPEVQSLVEESEIYNEILEVLKSGSLVKYKEASGLTKGGTQATKARLKEINAKLEEYEKNKPLESVVAESMAAIEQINKDMFNATDDQAAAGAVVVDKIIRTMASRAKVAVSEMYSKIQFRKGDKATLAQLKKDKKANFQGDQGKANFAKWRGSNKVYDNADIQNIKTGEAVVVEAFHGTTNEFYEFDASVKGSTEGHLGKVNYFTSNENDAHSNYLATGPDLQIRIEREGEQIEQVLEDHVKDGDIQYAAIAKEFGVELKDIKDLDTLNEVAVHIAGTRLDGGEENVLDVYVKLNNPVVIGEGNNWIDVIPEESYKDSLHDALVEISDENGITVEEAQEDYSYEVRDRAIELEGIENPIIEALNDAIQSNTGGNSNITLPEELSYESEIDLDVLEQSLRDNEELSYTTDEEGELMLNQIIADMFKNMGYDGIILTDVSKRFSNMGLDSQTSHIHVFDEFANQIKLSDGSNIEFGDTKDIRFQGVQGATLTEDAIHVIYAFESANISTPLHEIAHVYENYLTEEEKVDILEFAGQKKWNTKASEKFARGFENYLATGKAPNSKLKEIFSNFATWLKDIYNGIVSSDIDIELSPRMVEIYSEMLGEAISSSTLAEQKPAKDASLVEANGYNESDLSTAKRVVVAKSNKNTEELIKEGVITKEDCK